MNYYEILELDKDASEEQIKTSFHNLYRESKDNSFLSEEEKRDYAFQLIEAYESLSNPEKRKLYDLSDYKTIVITNDDDVKYPSIKSFEIDSISRKEKSEIIISWETANADYVEISPFGEMLTNGTGIFSIEEFKIPNDEIIITAINKKQNLVTKRKKELNFKDSNNNRGIEKPEEEKKEITKDPNDLVCQNCQNKLKKHHLYCGKCGHENPKVNFEKITSDLANSKEARKKINKVFWILFFAHSILEMIVGGSFEPSAFFPASINVLFSYLIVHTILKYKNVVNINWLIIIVYLAVLVIRTIIIGIYLDL